MERGEEDPLPAQRLEMLCPQGMTATHAGNENRKGIPPEPSIKNCEAWLTWWACFMDTSHWWRELTAIPDAEDPRRLAQQIHASFLMLMVRCETLQNQDYTLPPAPKCLSREWFLSNDPTYQDVHWQPLLLSLAYAWWLQYWVEKVNPPMLSSYWPLAMSIVGLRQQVEGHFTFSKQDIFHNLGVLSLRLEAKTQRLYKKVPLPHPLHCYWGCGALCHKNPWGRWHYPCIIRMHPQWWVPTSRTYHLTSWDQPTWVCRNFPKG